MSFALEGERGGEVKPFKCLIPLAAFIFAGCEAKDPGSDQQSSALGLDEASSQYELGTIIGSPLIIQGLVFTLNGEEVLAGLSISKGDVVDCKPELNLPENSDHFYIQRFLVMQTQERFVLDLEPIALPEFDFYQSLGFKIITPQVYSEIGCEAQILNAAGQVIENYEGDLRPVESLDDSSFQDRLHSREGGEESSIEESRGLLGGSQ